MVADPAVTAVRDVAADKNQQTVQLPFFRKCQFRQLPSARIQSRIRCPYRAGSRKKAFTENYFCPAPALDEAALDFNKFCKQH